MGSVPSSIHLQPHQQNPAEGAANCNNGDSYSFIKVAGTHVEIDVDRMFSVRPGMPPPTIMVAANEGYKKVPLISENYKGWLSFSVPIASLAVYFHRQQKTSIR